MMTLKETIKRLKDLEAHSEKKCYEGEAGKWAFFRHCLELLSIIAAKGKRKPTAYQLRLGKLLKAGKSIQEAHRLAKR